VIPVIQMAHVYRACQISYLMEDAIRVVLRKALKVFLITCVQVAQTYAIVVATQFHA